VFFLLKTPENVTCCQEDTKTMDACITEMYVNNSSVSVVPISGLEQTPKPLKMQNNIVFSKNNTFQGFIFREM